MVFHSVALVILLMLPFTTDAQSQHHPSHRGSFKKLLVEIQTLNRGACLLLSKFRVGEFHMAHISEKKIQSPKIVADRLSVSLSTLWRMVGDGRFPAPFAITDARKGWLASTVDDWIDKKSAI